MDGEKVRTQQSLIPRCSCCVPWCLASSYPALQYVCIAVLCFRGRLIFDPLTAGPSVAEAANRTAGAKTAVGRDRRKSNTCLSCPALPTAAARRPCVNWSLGKSFGHLSPDATAESQPENCFCGVDVCSYGPLPSESLDSNTLKLLHLFHAMPLCITLSLSLALSPFFFAPSIQTNSSAARPPYLP